MAGRHEAGRGFTLVEMLVALALLGMVTAAVGNWTIPFLMQEERHRNELLLQSESLLFYHDLSRELRAAERLEVRQGILYATITEQVDAEMWTMEKRHYQYYRDAQGRFVRRVWRLDRYEGYTIMLQHVRTLKMELLDDGSLRISGVTALGEAAHAFTWTVRPRMGEEGS